MKKALLLLLVLVLGVATAFATPPTYMDTPFFSAALQVGVGGMLVFLAGILIGSA